MKAGSSHLILQCIDIINSAWRSNNTNTWCGIDVKINI